MKRKIIAACLVLLLAVPAFALRSDRARYSHDLGASIDFTTWIDANKILMFVTNKGSFAYDNGVFLGKADGLYFPFTGLDDIASGKNTLSVIYAGSIWAGATVAATYDGAIAGVDDTIITSGQHDTDWGPGPLIDGASPPDAISNTSYRVYKLYADSLADNPNQDYLEWPVGDGAPVDENGDPLLIGDQMCWSVYNDLDVARHVGARGTVGIGLGIEVRQTAWAYAREGALANIVFMKFQIYNEGPYDLENMYVSLWSDPDLGDAGDDFVACDSARSLGYCYNDGDDANYGSRPPAVGYDFFQGPLQFTGSDDDTAKMWGLDWVGYTNMPMSSFNVYINPYGPDTPTDSYRFMNGLLKDGSDLIHPVTLEKTMFFGTGDPVTGDPSGFYDVNSSDRRFMQSVGPITLNQGDSTEIVAAILCGQGTDRLRSITELRAIDDFAQKVYDNNFQLPDPPARPVVKVTNLRNEIVLSWGQDSEENHGDFPFEGYALFQGPSRNGPWTDTLMWSDLVNGMAGIIDYRFSNAAGQDLPYVAKPGTDGGLQRYFSTSRDVTDGGDLTNYTEYFFRVEAYSADTLQPNGEKTLTSATVVTVMPQSQSTGTEVVATTDDTLAWDHSLGASDGSITVEVVDPTAITGDAYKVTFDDDGWNVINTSTGETVVSGWTNQGTEGLDDFPIVDGLLIKAFGPPLEGNDWDYASADPANISPVALADDPEYEGGRWFTGGGHGGELFFGGVFMEPNFWGLTSLAPAEYPTVEVRWRPMASYTDLTGDGAYTIGEPFVVDDPLQTQGAFMYTGFSGDTYEGFFDVPFTAWDVTDPVNPRQLNVAMRDRDGNLAWNLHFETTDPLLPNGGDLRYNYTWILNTDYDATGTMYGDGTGGTIDFWGYADGDGVWDAAWVMWMDDRGNGGTLAEECIFTLIPNFVNSAADEYTFTTAGYEPSVATTGAENLLDNIKAVPNPYYLYSEYDDGLYNRNLKFINLPAECRIDIYNLGGDLVRSVEKEDLAATELTWDLLNSSGVPVGSGIYIYVIDAPAFGQKIGKMAIFTEVELLDQY